MIPPLLIVSIHSDLIFGQTGNKFPIISWAFESINIERSSAVGFLGIIYDVFYIIDLLKKISDSFILVKSFLMAHF